MEQIKRTNPSEYPNTCILVGQKDQFEFFGPLNDCSQFLFLESENDWIRVMRVHREKDSATFNDTNQKLTELQSLLEQKEKTEQQLLASIQQLANEKENLTEQKNQLILKL